MADTSSNRQNVEIDEKEVPQQLDYQQDGGKVSMAAPMDKAEQRLVWKLDLLIMPITFILYLLAYLDRSNLGNAKLQGLESTLMPNDESGNQFALLSAMFYIAYLCWQIPLTLTAKRFPPNIVIGVVTIAWGAASSLQAVAFNYAGVTTARYFLGLFEAGFGPVIPFYYSLFYLKSEHGFRTSFFISAAPLAGAFGGLIAYGVQHIHSHIATWRILFLIEGLPTILVGIIVLLLLPSRPETTKWLTEDERKLAQRRLNREVASEGRSINWKHVIMSFTDYKAWMICLMYQSLNVALSSISVFLPTIVKTLGYTNAKAQLMTVPPYACAGVVMLVVAKISDRAKVRGPFVAAVLVLSAIGYTILLAVPTTATKARYGAIFLAVSGTYSGIPLAMSWTTGNAGSETRRGVNMAMLNTIGHSMAVLGSYIYPSREGPAYTRGFAICCGFAWWGAFLALVLSLLLHLENRRRDRREGKPSQGETPNTAINADKAEGFRYVL
ncbi:major facilitator superfamily transporter [Rhizoctonia solani]|uniref:Major facilitator superfamily transporter n=1 Tax=Rhizoctonia solani TaxID=456999 RepID=A0A8H8P689_9AGAM|nr:major facilitator superfamily transporter [Rhizoctonia solani]QRW25473.1 major facilitator superfamily transporter [Rhizoctonia solani]